MNGEVTRPEAARGKKWDGQEWLLGGVTLGPGLKGGWDPPKHKGTHKAQY